jgi:predicted nucleotidyltransferase
LRTVHEENVAAIVRLLDVLPEWEDEVLFIGGATLGFFVESIFHDAIRVTKDIDVVVEIATLKQHRVLQERLRNLGFVEQFDHMTRWKRGDLIVDVLPLKLPEYLSPKPFLIEIFGRGNRVHLPNDRQIRVPDLAEFLALKFQAHAERGNGDWIAKDIEDIVTVVDGAAEPFHISVDLSQEMKTFLRESIAYLRADPGFQNVMPGLLPTRSNARVGRFNQRLEHWMKLLHGK